MMRRAAQVLFIAVFVLFMVGCGSQSSPPPVQNPVQPSAATAPVSITLTDDPPTGVTVLFFQLSITSASLTPQSGSSVSLLGSSTSIPVNVTQLQTDSAFLGSANVDQGTYTGLNLTFANPELTIYNDSGATIGSGANACANNTVCQLTPAFDNSSASLSFTSTPFPLTLSANSPLAFVLDVNMNTVIQQDLSVNLAAPNGVTISQLPAPPSGQPTPPLGHVWGTVESITPTTGTPTSFTLQTLFGKTLTIDLNGTTTYNYPSSVCSADNSTCLATQQIVKVEVSVQSDGSLLASEVDYEQAAGQATVEGNILRLSTSNGNTLMDLILQNGPNAPNTLPLGHKVTVTVPATGVTYAVDNGTFTLPGGLSFTQASDLTPGQEVTVAVPSTVSTGSGSNNWGWGNNSDITFTTTSITLEPSQISGTVGTVNASGNTFTLVWNQGFFVPFSFWGASAPNWAMDVVNVITTGQTTFTGFTTDTVAGVAANDFVSVQGFLYATPSPSLIVCSQPTACPANTTVAAETVTDRPGPTPLF